MGVVGRLAEVQRFLSPESHFKESLLSMAVSNRSTETKSGPVSKVSFHRPWTQRTLGLQGLRCSIRIHELYISRKVYVNYKRMLLIVSWSSIYKDILNKWVHMLQILWKLYSNSLNIHLAINSLWRSWLHFDRTPPTCPAGAGDWRLAYVKKYFLRAHRCPGWVFGSKLLICVGTNGILPLLNRTAGEQLRRHLYHSSMWFYQQYIYISIYDLWMSMIISSSHHLLGSKSLQNPRRQGRRRLERPGGHLRWFQSGPSDYQELTNPGHLAGPRRNDKESNRLREHHDMTES